MSFQFAHMYLTSLFQVATPPLFTCCSSTSQKQFVFAREDLTPFGMIITCVFDYPCEKVICLHLFQYLDMYCVLHVVNKPRVLLEGIERM